VCYNREKKGGPNTRRTRMKKLLLFLILGLSVVPAKADYWTYIYLMYNGWMSNDMGRCAQKQAANMMLGTMLLPTETQILSTEGDKLAVNQKTLDNMAEVFDNVGVKATSDALGQTSVELEASIEFGDVTDKTLENALKQAEELGIDPTQLQAMGAGVKATAKAQAFDTTLREYEKLGGTPMTLNERSALNAKIQNLTNEQMNEKVLMKMAQEFAEASRAQQKLEAEQIGRQVVNGHAMNDININKGNEDYSAFAPPRRVEVSPDLYKYEALGGIRRLGSVLGANPVTGQPEVQQLPTTPADEFQGLNSSALPPGNGDIGNTAYSMIGTSTAGIKGTEGGNMGCAAATSMMFKQATGQDILPGRDIVLGTGDLYHGLSNDSRFVRVPFSQAGAGDIVVTARNGGVAGHTGIVGNNGQIISNSSSGFNGSAKGTIQNNYTVDKWQTKVMPRNPNQTGVFRYVGG